MPSETTTSRRRRAPWVMAALIFGLALACYWPALRGGMLWDDAAHMTRPDLRSWSGLGLIWFKQGATQQYYPILHTAFWIEHRLWGDATLGYHLVNVLLHAASSCLFALILRRMMNGYSDLLAEGPERRRCAGVEWPAMSGVEWLAAAIFAVHPVGVESVAWISEQKNTLSLLFYLLAALAYLEFDARRGRRAYALASVFFLLALGTKTVTASLPAALLLMLWWQRGRISWKRDVVPLIPWFVLAAAAGLFTAWVERRIIGAQGAPFALSAVERLLLAGRVIWFYLGKLVWPSRLMFIYPHWQVTAAGAGWLAGLAGVGALTAALWLVQRRGGGPFSRVTATALTGWLFFIGSLFPVLGFFNIYPFLFSYVADHFQYLPSLGIIAIAAPGLALLLNRGSPAVRTAGRVAGVLLVAGLAVLSNHQSRSYRDRGTLYRATLALNPACWMARVNLAVDLAGSPAGVPEALAQYAEALRLNPANAEGHNNYANLLATLPGRVPEALDHYEHALRLRPDFADAHANYANLLSTLPGRMPEALDQYAEALRLEPGTAEIHYSLANALARIPGRQPEALAQYEEALRLNPDFAQAHVNLANELAKLPGRMPEALAHYGQALRIDPRLALAHYNLAVQLSELPGREAEARRHYEEALRLRPDYAKAENDLGVLDARQGRFDEAKRHWERAVQLDPAYEDPQRNLELLRRRQQP